MVWNKGKKLSKRVGIKEIKKRGDCGGDGVTFGGNENVLEVNSDHGRTILKIS